LWKFPLSKHLTFLHFTLPFLMKNKNKTLLKEIIQNTFKFRNNGKQRYKLILLRINLLYQVRNKLQKSTTTSPMSGVGKRHLCLREENVTYV
jgi:hypothetical protein